MEVAEADQTDLLESGKAAIDGDQIASCIGEITVNLLNAGGG
jgi:hypothetical protein